MSTTDMTPKIRGRMHCHQSLIAGELDILDFLFVFISVMLEQLDLTRIGAQNQNQVELQAPPFGN